MGGFILRIDDVGRLPGDAPHQGSDRLLKHFGHWRAALGLQGLPVYYGLCPAWVDHEAANQMKATFTADGKERWAVHGWSHQPGEAVTREQMELSRGAFRPCDAYIPPFNDYNAQTLANWGAVGGRFFFGGRNTEHHGLGDYPEIFDEAPNVLHLPAEWPLYGRTHEIMPRLVNYGHYNHPLVVTLHVPWESDGYRLGRFGKQIRERLVSAEDAFNWYCAAMPSRQSLTAPHWLAYRFALEHARPGLRVLDFGARYSRLPTLFALRACRVTATDRDPLVDQWQRAASLTEDVDVTAEVWDATTPPPAGEFDLITACWAIQHNLDDAGISTVAKNLARRLAPGGKLVVVGSFSPGETFTQRDRKDPQQVLNGDGHRRLIVDASGLTQEGEATYFHYAHATETGGYCHPREANAVAYVLQRPGPDQ